MQRTMYPPQNKTANFTLTELESGQTFEIDAVDITATLPSDPAPGVFYRFVIKDVSVTTGFSISPAAADSINSGTANKDLINTPASDVLGDSCEVTYAGSNNWLTTSMHGIWAAEA